MTGLGVDLETTDRFKSLSPSIHARFLNRIYTPGELASAFRRPRPWSELARRFAGKEAVFKALSGAGCRGARLKDIEILLRQNGTRVLLRGRRLARARTSLSVSSAGRFVFAVAVAEAR